MSDFEIVPVSGSGQFSECLLFLREHFFPSEPCAVALDLCPHGYTMPAVENDISDILGKNLSFAAFLPDTKEMVGLVIIDSKKVGDAAAHSFSEATSRKQLRCLGTPEKFSKLERFFNDLCNKRSVFDALGVASVIDVYIVVTSPKMQRRGVGTALIREALSHGRRKGFESAQCMALSAHTQRICSNLGMRELNAIEYASYARADDGERIFAGAKMGEHTRGMFMAMKI